MTTIHYAIKNASGEVLSFAYITIPEPPPEIEGVEIDELVEAVPHWPEAPFIGAVLVCSGGVLSWRDDRLIQDVKANAIAEIDAVGDAARLSVVGDAARIKEYERAQAGAEAYRDAGFSGPIPSGVASWAHAKRRSNWTARQAAEDILSASERWYAALDGIRALRLDAKEGVRFATTTGEVAETTATFRTALIAAMEGVQ
jgi:hypothetical protein